MPTLGGPELWILLLIVLVLFGGSKIPQLMRGLGEGMREFRKATEDDEPKQKNPNTLPPGDTTTRV